MDKGTSALTIAVLALLVGGSLGAVITSIATPVKEVPYEVEKLVEVPVEVPVAGEPETIEVEVPNANLFLDSAIEEVFDEYGDDEDFLTCSGHEFDEDEVVLNRVTEWSYTWLDDDEYEVTFDAKFEFEDNSDERDCKETRSFTVQYEEDEKPEAIWN